MQADLAGFFTDFGIPATRPLAAGGAESATVILDMPDQQIFGGGQLSTEYLITYPSTSLVGLKTGDSLTAGGVEYSVREVLRIDDGAIMSARLKRVYA